MGSGRIARIGVAAGLCLAAVSARAQDGPATADKSGAETKASEFESWLAGQLDPKGRPCIPSAVDALGDRWVVACGESGLWIARRNSGGAIVLVRVEDLGGPVVGLFRREGRVWAEVLRREARDVAAVDENASQAAFPSEPSPGAPPSVPSPARAPRTLDDPTFDAAPKPLEGRVTQVLPGEVVVNIGENQGLSPGDRVELSVVTEVDISGETGRQRKVVAVGAVKVTSERFARVELGIDERVPVGAFVRPVDADLTAKRGAPPRLGGLWHAGFMLRPFLALDEYGGGFLADASVGYRFDTELHVEACLSPLAYGTAEDKPSAVPYGAFVKASYDTDVFELGFGMGAETVKDVPFETDPGSGILFVQQLRLGAVDGLALDFQSHAVLFHSRFQFSGLVGRGQIPVGRRFWLLFAGGGGSAGYGYGETGVRALLRGNGDRGSFFFTGTLGGMAVFENLTVTCVDADSTSPCPEDVNYGGPMIGAGGEWRF